jgi:sigma-B regulation protein RsbU (phosphoserine phosphatase)
MAKELQLRFLPPPKCLDKVCFEWLFEASSYVGGDTFDYFCIDARHICFYVVDVAGHGVSSSLLAFNAQHQILAAASHTADLLVKHDRDLAFVAATMVADFNSKFLSMKDTSLYMTMIYGLLDMETGEVALVQAGHPPPLYSDPAQGTVTAVGDGGLPIGILPNATYEAHTLRLAPGSRLYIYSDGVPDCFNDASEAFGLERMQHILTEQQSAPLSKVHEAMRNALMAWHGKGGSFEDDVTFLAIEYGDHVIGRPKR